MNPVEMDRREMLTRISKAESDNREFASLWRKVMRPDNGLPENGREALRRTARAALEDWMEAR